MTPSSRTPATAPEAEDGVTDLTSQVIASADGDRHDRHMSTITGVSHIDLTVSDLDRSEAWYSDLFGLTRILDGRNDDHHFSSRYLLHPESLLIIGLVAHDEAAGNGTGDAFDEHRIGLDHLSLNVPSAEELREWAGRLDDAGIDHSPIAEGEMWDVLVLRDPDGIQLELFFTKPEAAELLTG